MAAWISRMLSMVGISPEVLTNPNQEDDFLQKQRMVADHCSDIINILRKQEVQVVDAGTLGGSPLLLSGHSFYHFIGPGKVTGAELTILATDKRSAEREMERWVHAKGLDWKGFQLRAVNPMVAGIVTSNDGDM
jgi:ABC-type xylose transport system substrate-binding protein